MNRIQPITKKKGIGNMSYEFEQIYNELQLFTTAGFAEMHRLIAECDRAEKHALEVLARCK